MWENILGKMVQYFVNVLVSSSIILYSNLYLTSRYFDNRGIRSRFHSIQTRVGTTSPPPVGTFQTVSDRNSLCGQLPAGSGPVFRNRVIECPGFLVGNVMTVQKMAVNEYWEVTEIAFQAEKQVGKGSLLEGIARNDNF